MPTTSVRFNVNFADDNDCDDEDFSLGFSGLPGDVETGTHAAPTVAIEDDDDCVVNISASPTNPAENSNVTVTVSIPSNSPISNRSLSIPVVVAAGTAEAGDYSVSGLPVTISPGSRSATFTISVSEDALEDCENDTVIARFGATRDFPDNVVTGSSTSVTIVIQDDEPTRDCQYVVTYDRSSYSGDEGDSVSPVVSITPTPNRSITVGLTATTGTTESGDYTRTATQARFNATTTSVRFNVNFADDNDCDDEDFSLGFSGLPDDVETGTQAAPDVDIDDLDACKLKFSSGSDINLTEGGSARGVTVEFLDGITTDRQVTVPIDVSGSGAYRFTGLNSQDELVFSANARSDSFNIAAGQDADCDNESLTLELGSPAPSDVGLSTPDEVGVNITDDESDSDCDQPGEVSLSPSSPELGETITAALKDPDGILPGITWLWESSSDQSTWTAISGATAASYTPAVDDLAKWLRATATYTDGHGSGKSAMAATSTAVPLPAPSGLAITPLATPVDPRDAKREARLSWVGADIANIKYTVEARAPTVLSNAWTTLDVLTLMMESPKCIGSKCTIDFEMDSIIDSKGFADASSYQFQVRATLTTSSGDTISSASSKEIAVRDTPILSVNGDSRGRRDGKAVVQWSTVPNATKYTVRWRRLPAIPTTDGAPDVSHDYIGWQPQSAASDTAWLDSTTVVGNVQEYTITGLLLGEIYAIQLNYTYTVSREPVVAALREGFSVREAYVWPSDRAGAATGHEGERVATFPLKRPFATKEYRYVVCEDTFPNGKEADWKKFITHAISQWDLATNGLVDTQRVDGNCANYSTFVDQVVAKVKLFAQSMPLAGAFPTDAEILAYAEHLLDNFDKSRIGSAEIRDEGLSEVLMVDDSSATAVTVAAFAEISRQVGHGWCKYACTSHPAAPLNTVDIRFRGSRFQISDPTVPGADDRADPGEIKFNSCESVGRRYGTVVHEAGHAFGIRGGITGDELDDGQGAHHPHINDSVMSYRGDSSVSCSPNPFDVMAIYALYQSR